MCSCGRVLVCMGVRACACVLYPTLRASVRQTAALEADLVILADFSTYTLNQITETLVWWGKLNRCCQDSYFLLLLSSVEMLMKCGFTVTMAITTSDGNTLFYFNLFTKNMRIRGKLRVISISSLMDPKVAFFFFTVLFFQLLLTTLKFMMSWSLEKYHSQLGLQKSDGNRLISKSLTF